MKKILLTLLGSLLLFANAQANMYTDLLSSFDNGQFYGEIFSGVNFFDLKNNQNICWDPGFVVSGSIGYKLCNGLRFEIEHAYRQNSLKVTRRYMFKNIIASLRERTFSYMFNVVYDLMFCERGCNIQPFIGFGIGYDAKFSTMSYIYHSKSFDQYTYKCQNFAWQCLAGLRYPICYNTDISLEYRFHKTNFEKGYNHAVGLGLTYNFGS